MASASIEQIVRSLRTKHDEWDTAWRQRHVEADNEVIYHYTDAHGLLGIVQGRQLWASNAAFLNDSTELTYIREVLAEVAENPETSGGDGRHARVRGERLCGDRSLSTCGKPGRVGDLPPGRRADDDGWKLGCLRVVLLRVGGICSASGVAIHQVVVDTH